MLPKIEPIKLIAIAGLILSGAASFMNSYAEDQKMKKAVQKEVERVISDR